MALAATAALVVGIPGGRTPFAALAAAFFSPPEPGSVIFWRLLPLPRGRGHVNLCPLRRRSRGERGHVNLCPLRRRSRGERAPVKLGALCPRSGRVREQHT